MTADKMIKALEERCRVLDEAGIKYSVDDELNLSFSSSKEREEAEKIMRKALVL